MNPNNTPNIDDQLKAGPISMDQDPMTSMGALPPIQPMDIQPMPSSGDMGGEIKPKRKMNPKLLLGALAIVGFIVAGGVLAYQSSSSNGFLAQNQDTRSRATCTQCGGGTCPDGWSYGGDSCWLGGDCGGRDREACGGHQGGQQQQQQAPPPPPPPQQQQQSCNCDGHTACGAQADNHQNCRKYLCNNGSWQDIGAANSGPCTGQSAPAQPAATAAPQQQAPASSGGSSGGGSCSGWSCNGNCATSSVMGSFNSVWCDGQGRWMYEAGCGGNASSPKSSGCGGSAPASSGGTGGGGGATTSTSTSGACAEGQTRCRDNASGVPEFNDVCRGGQWTAGGNACTPTSGGQSASSSCSGGVSCAISYCQDNYAVSPDPCYKGGSCVDRLNGACAGHSGAQGGVGGTNINQSTGGSSAATTYKPGTGSGKGSIGDACVPGANDCGYSGNVELGCNSCGAAIGYKCTGGGSTTRVEIGCAQPGTVVTNFPSGCGGLGAFQIRCKNDGSYVGEICVPVQQAATVSTSIGDLPIGGNVNTSQWHTTTVVADACGATCENGGIQQSTSGESKNRCSGDTPGSSVVGSGFMGCGNVVTGGNGDKCSNCYKINGAIVCQREGSSCGANVECTNQTVASAPGATSAPQQQASAPQSSGGGGGGSETPTTTTVTEAPGMCVAVKLWIKDTSNEWVNIPFTEATTKVKVGDTIRLSTSGGGRVFTQGRFRIKVGAEDYGAWQTTSTKDKGEYYINYVIPSLSTFSVQSQVF